jgi:UrcA family protein
MYRPAIVAAMLAAGVLAAVSAGAAKAATHDLDSPSVVVKYHDLNLATAAGNQVLYGRIVRAAAKVCPAEFVRDPRMAAMAQICRDQAIARAVYVIHSPQLAALHAAKSRNG